jgi:hypothetical protein
LTFLKKSAVTNAPTRYWLTVTSLILKGVMQICIPRVVIYILQSHRDNGPVEGWLKKCRFELFICTVLKHTGLTIINNTKKKKTKHKKQQTTNNNAT